MDTIGFARHDHGHCISESLSAVEAQCKRDGLHLTAVRRRVLEILLQEHRALGAYDILDRLRDEGLGSQPPVAYRALDFLVSHGFAHRIEQLNAFVACAHMGDAHAPAFLICKQCAAVAEARTQPDRSQLMSTAKEAGFAIESAVFEAQGLCPSCQSQSPDSEATK